MTSTSERTGRGPIWVAGAAGRGPGRSCAGAVVALMMAAATVGVVNLSGCTKPGRSVVRVRITADASLATALAEVDIFVTRAGGGTFRTATFNWTTAADYGVFLPADVDGVVMVTATGFAGSVRGNAAGIAVSAAPATTSVRPGAVASVMLNLVPGTPVTSPDAGTDGTGGTAGTGGAAGSTGSGGSSVPDGGAGPADGGAAAGGGGSTGGRGGVSGSTGVGTGGTAGPGGAACPGGAAGPTWRGSQRPDPNSILDDTYPAVAVDSLGNVVTAYVHGASIWASRFSAVTGVWAAPVAIDGRTGGNASNPSIAVDKNGQWLAVWQQAYDNTLHGIWGGTSADGIVWSAPAAVTTAGRDFDPVLAMNRDGVAVVVWQDTTGNQFTLTGSVRAAAGAWSMPHVLKAAVDAGERYAAVAVSGRGDALVTWEQDDDTPASQLSVWMARFAPTNGWGTATLLESLDGNQAYSARVAANGVGQAIFTWIQATTSTAELWARRFSADGTLAAAARVAEGTDIAWSPSPSVTLDETGTATAAWAFSVRNKFNVYTARAAWDAAAWPAPTAMEVDNAAADDRLNMFEWAPNPLLGSDAAGNVVLVWRKRAGARFDLWGQRFAAGAWGTPTLLENRDTVNVVIPQLAVGSGGVAAAVWIYYAEFEIWANVLR